MNNIQKNVAYHKGKAKVSHIKINLKYVLGVGDDKIDEMIGMMSRCHKRVEDT